MSEAFAIPYEGILWKHNPEPGPDPVLSIGLTNYSPSEEFRARNHPVIRHLAPAPQEFKMTLNSTDVGRNAFVNLIDWLSRYTLDLWYCDKLVKVINGRGEKVEIVVSFASHKDAVLFGMTNQDEVLG